MLTIEVVGQGVIYGALQWESTARLNAGGSFSFSLPATDPGASLIVALRTVRCRWRGAVVAAGIVSRWEVGAGVLQVRGEDMARELATRTLTATIQSGGGAMSLYNAVQWLIGQLPAGWTGVNGVAPGNPATIYLQAVNDSILAILGAICELGGCWYAISGTTLTVDDSLGAVRYSVPLLSLSQSIDSADIVNRIFLRGAGEGEAALDLGPASVSPPAGYTVNVAASSLTWSSSPYPTRERAVSMPWIGPLAATNAGVEAAANALLRAGVQWLQRYATPVVSFSAAVAYPGVIAPLERVALNWRGDGIVVNATPAVTEARLSIDPEHLLTTSLTLEVDGRRLPTDAEVIAQALRDANRARTWPQIALGSETLEGRSGTITHTATDGSVVVTWPAQLVQMRSATLTLAAEALDASHGPPAGLQWRLNGTGSWTTYSTPVDITASVRNATSRRPLAGTLTVNVRGVAATELIRTPTQSIVGVSWPTAGSIVTVTLATTLRKEPLTHAELASGLEPGKAVLEGTRLVCLDSFAHQVNNFQTVSGQEWRAQWLRVELAGEEHYVLVYVYNQVTQVIQEYGTQTLGIRRVSTAQFDATVRVQVAVSASMLEQ